MSLSKGKANIENEESLKRLINAIRLSEGEFSLFLVQCDYTRLREELTRKIKESCQIRSIVLDPTSISLHQQIHDAFSSPSPLGVLVYGLEQVKNIPSLLASANQGRDEFSHHFQFPIVLWVTTRVQQQLSKFSADLYSWASTPIEFMLSDEELLDTLERTADAVFSKVLEAGTGIFLNNGSLDLKADSNRRLEFESAYHTLQSRSTHIPLALQASTEFVLGRAVQGSSHDDSPAREHYERSLELWKQYEAQSSPIAHAEQMVERKGCALFSLGLWWGSYGTRHRSQYRDAMLHNRRYLEECIDLFKSEDRPVLVEKFINALALSIQILSHLEEDHSEIWNDLERVAKEALHLHQRFSEPFREARAYGFLAEVAVSRSNWKEAKQHANQALEIMTGADSDASYRREHPQTVEWERSYHQGWYLYTLARAEAAIGEVQRAIAHLEKGKKETKTAYDPDLYIRILIELEKYRFEEGDYLQAFEAKQERRTVEQQYGIRAFIGAVPLQPERKIANPVFPKVDDQETIAEEVNTPSRIEVVKDIFKRIVSDEHKLTVLCGQSGAGKSSILQAGLVPTLKQKTINARPITPFLQRRYIDDWLSKLGRSLEERQGSSLHIHDYDSCLEYLRHSASSFFTVLILDEFEELFFVRSEAEQKEFFVFLQSCLNISFVKVVISLREDHLHYLLRWKRFIPFKLLGEKVFYYVGNYLPEDARTFLENLSNEPQLSFSLESDLVSVLVDDLAGESGDIRPIELQIVGKQLETEGITTLAQYEDKGPKEQFVIRFLEEVIRDCGSENEEVTGLVLYLLTDENNTRPFKTRADFESYLDGKHTKTVDLVLDILTRSRLVIKEYDSTTTRYRLSYDYLVPFIRQQKGFNLRAELKQTKEELRQAIWKERQAKIKAENFQQQTEMAEASTLCLLAQSQFLAGDQLGGVVASVKAIRHIVSSDLQTSLDTESLDRLRQVIYGARERNRIEGHSAGVWDVGFSPDGQRLATASVDETIGLWNLDGSLIRKFRGHRDWVWSIAFRADGQMLASASDDNTVKVWTLEGEEIVTFRGHQASVRSVRFSPDDPNVLASASEDGTVKTWNLSGEEILTFEGHTAGLRSVRFSPDGSFIASGGDDHLVKVWWRHTGKELRTFDRHQDSIWSVRFNPEGNMIASASADMTVRLWSIDGEERQVFRGHNAIVRGVRFSPDGELLASASADGVIKIWRRDGTEVQTIKGHRAGVRGLSFSPTQPVLVSAGSDKTVRFWQIDSRALMTLRGHNDWVWGVDWSPESHLLASVSADNFVQVWDLKARKSQPLEKHIDLVRGVSFSSDGQWLATGSADRTVVLWNLKNRQSRVLRGHMAKIWSVAFSPDSTCLASASDDGMVKIWAVEDDAEVTLRHEERLKCVRFSPDGETVISGDTKGRLWFWSVAGDRKNRYSVNSSGIRSLAVHPHDNLLAIASADNVITLCDFEGHLIHSLEGHQAEVWSVDFSPNGELIASASADRTVRLWLVNEGIEAKIFQGHDAAVLSVSFSPDGKTLASASEDRTVKLWRVDNLEPQTPDLKSIVRYGCNWLKDYLATSTLMSDHDRAICRDACRDSLSESDFVR